MKRTLSFDEYMNTAPDGPEKSLIVAITEDAYQDELEVIDNIAKNIIHNSEGDAENIEYYIAEYRNKYIFQFGSERGNKLAVLLNQKIRELK